MLTIAGYIKTLKKYANDDSISNEDFFRLVFDAIIKNLGIYNRRGRERGLYDFSKGSISDLLNCKTDVSKTVRRPICENKDKLLAFFPELLKKCLDERCIAKARQELLVLAGTDERCKPFIDDYSQMNNTEFFVATFVDAINGQNIQGSEWRICSAQETGKKALDISNQIMENDQALYKDIPPECSGTREQWANMFRLFPGCSRFLISRSGDICGNFSFIVLSQGQEKQMLQGTLVDKDLQIADCLRLDEPGTYSIYLLNLSINQGVPVEQYNRLWDSFFKLIEDYAERDILISRVYYKAFIPEHEAKMLGRGFYYHKDDKIYGKIYIREISRQSDFFCTKAGSLSDTNKMEAEEAYFNLMQKVDELFYDSRFYELKPYFYNGVDISAANKNYALGVATAEFIRDTMQYASSLVDFLPDYRKRSHEQFNAVLQQSKLVQHSKQQYTFATENPEHLASKLDKKANRPFAIVKFAGIWLGIDKLFMQEDIIHLRPFFYERRDQLPDLERDVELGIGLAVRIMSGLVVAAGLLTNVPEPFVMSYYAYRDMLKETQFIQEAATRYPFLAKELGF